MPATEDGIRRREGSRDECWIRFAPERSSQIYTGLRYPINLGARGGVLRSGFRVSGTGGRNASNTWVLPRSKLDGRKRITGFSPSEEIPKAEPSQGSLTAGKLDVKSSTVDSIQDMRLRKLMRLIDADPLGTIHDWALAFNLSHSSHLCVQ